MQRLLERVLELNQGWTAQNTPSMAERGHLIRRDIVDWIRDRADSLATTAQIPVKELGVEGRDATGMKNEVPWVRIHSRTESPNATAGWYVVYLFDALGDRVYLSLNQGTTEWTGSDFRLRPPDELRARVAWARHVLGPLLRERPDLVSEISLHSRRSPLGPAYERGNVLAIAYDAGAVPGPEQLDHDLILMARLLGHTYAADAAAPYVPGDLPPEVVGVVELATTVAGGRAPRRRGGQGFGLTKAEQLAVEGRAIEVAEEHLERQGWKVLYVGARQTWDCEATRDKDKIYVEVKGTTSPGETVILTGAQVREYRKKHPNTALIVVRDIVLDRSGSEPVATGGEPVEIRPWVIENDALSAIAWTYRTGLPSRVV